LPRIGLALSVSFNSADCKSARQLTALTTDEKLDEPGIEFAAMPLPVTSEYAPPQSWEEFESLCADVYSKVWQTKLEKNGRQGQPQGGVDVYGQPDGTNYSGIQCKKKRKWPPEALTTDDIDEEVEKAKSWKPGLKKYFIATTAPNDAKAQAHARTITEAHAKSGLFSVEILSWDEVTRDLASYPGLLDKYYPQLVSSVAPQIEELPEKTAKLVIQHLREEKQAEAGNDAGLSLTSAEALERDLSAHFERVLKRSFFPESIKTDEFVTVADIAAEPEYASVSPALRRSILLRAARSEAVRGDIEKAKELLRAAQDLQGPDSDRVARARLLERQGDIDGAMALIRDQTDPDAVSTMLNVIVRARGHDAGLKFFSDKKLTLRDLTINGVQTLVAGFLQTDDFEAVRTRLNELDGSQFEQGPYFRLLKAVAHIASVLPEPDRALAVQGFQTDASKGKRSILDPETTAARLDVALQELSTFLPIASALGLSQAKRLAEGYLRWAELLHPYRHQAGLTHLRDEMRDPQAARSRLSLAFAFDPDFDPKPLEAYLKEREELGGLDDEDLHAALTIQINSSDPASVAALIAKYRPRFEANYDPPIYHVEIQALALAGDASSARLLLEKHKDEIPADGLTFFESLIAKSEGGDSVTEDLKVYEANKTVDALRRLVSSLARKKDHRATAKYSEELYGQTKDPQDIARAAQAFAFLGDGAEFIRVMEGYPFLQDQETDLLDHYGWQLFRTGRLKDAAATAEKLTRLDSNKRDLQLEIAITIESGEWESLAKPLSAYLDNVSKYSGLALMRAAHLAQLSGQGPMMDLMKAAVAKADDNPHVWLGAYTLIIEEGLEEENPEAHDWLHRALVLSGKKGPVQRFELKELVPQQVEWNKRTRDISERITRAEVPLVIAAPGLRTTVVDILLRNLIRNARLEDARRKYVIPLFSGHRSPSKCGPQIKSIGLDISALLVLGWLGLLPKVLDAFEAVSLPASILTELFEGRRRVQHIQKSRIKRARELEQAILRNRVKIARPLEKVNDPLSLEIGSSLAALIRAAAETDGTVLRPAPIHKPGLEQIDADVSGQLTHLSDMHSLLQVLKDKGIVNQKQEETAKKYFELQDKGLDGSKKPDPDKPLFIDGLALVYLQYTELLDPVLQTFKDVRVEGGSEDEALAIIDHNQHVEEVLGVIDDVRGAIRQANARGKIQFGPHRPEGKKGRNDDTPSTLNLLSDLTKVDALVCDDRALNKENWAADNNGKRIPCLTSLDLLEELQSRGLINETERVAARHELRKGAAAVMPVDVGEIVHAANRSGGSMSAELRAILESIDLARLADIPSFPREVHWYARLNMAAKAAVIEIWKANADHKLAARLANLAMAVVPKPEDWASRWEPMPPPQWVIAVNRITMASLAMPIELADDNTVKAYQEWFEHQHLEPLRSVWPKQYQAVVEQVRAIALSAEDEEDEKQNPKPKIRKKKSVPSKKKKKPRGKR
jgi:Flp pilus assembly protein TadD